MNILVTAQGIPKIADFGIARVVSSSVTSCSDIGKLSQAGTGNPNFMSPEQARGDPADFSSDLFMIGIIGYLLMTGRHPFAHASGLFTIPELLQDPDYIPEAPRPPSTLTTSQQRLFREYAAVVMRLLHRECSGRFARALEAVEALRAVTPSLDCPACAESVPEHHHFCGFCGASLESQPPNVSATSATTGPAKRTADQFCEEGFQLSRQGNWPGAIERYRDALKLDLNHLKTHWNLGFALNRVGRFSEAEEVLSDGLSLGEHDHRQSHFYERSLARSNQKKYEEAFANINEALNLQPSVKFLYFRARLELYRGNVQEAKSDATQVLKWVPDHSGAIRLLDDLG